MNKQELQNEINKTKEHLANMEKMLAECEYERWKPKEREPYFFFTSYGVIETTTFNNKNEGDIRRYNFYNCFQTYEQAEAEAEKILVRRMLEDIARRLNKGEKIDFKDNKQAKYYLRYNIDQGGFDVDLDFNIVRVGVTYCLDRNFPEIAIQEIGEERLKKYLRGE